MASARCLLLWVVAAAASCTYAPAAKRSEVTPVEVDVYYESLCPDSKRFFIKQLWPTYRKLGSAVNLKLIPYGNAHVEGCADKWTFTCQHGPEECLGNMIQTCAIEVLDNTMDSMKFVICAFNSHSQDVIIDKCIRDKDLQEKVKNCSDGAMGKNLEHEMAVLTDSLQPKHTFIPWITVNKKGSETINNAALSDLLGLLCDSYQGEKPSPCPSKTMRRKRRYERGVYL